MNIKEEIGRRIFKERKAKDLTRKALAELTDDLKPSRISNWERGIRTPGPEEIKQLAKALDISPAFLMCLTSEKQSKKLPGFGALLPILTTSQAYSPKKQVLAIKNHQQTEHTAFIPIDTATSWHLGDYAFAFKMNDDSMEPELKRQDILIVDPDKEATPGCFVLARIVHDHQVIVRRYKQLSASMPTKEFELLPLNENWPCIQSSRIQCKLLGSVCSLYRNFLS